MNVLFASSEAAPFVASGGLADVAGALPAALNKANVNTRVVIPYYGKTKKAVGDKVKFLTNFTVDVAWRKQYCGVFSGESNGITYYFIDNEYYFNREGIYGFYDDCERFVFFSRAILELLRYIDFQVDIIHCNDWQTALVPVYYQVFYKYQQGYANLKTVFTIHNIQYQGKYGREILTELCGIPTYYSSLLDYDGCINLMKGAFETADKITTVSPTYAKEILDPWFSYGLDRVLTSKQYKLTGFLNGIDTELYNPAKDSQIVANYTSKNIAGKQKCKDALIKELGLLDDIEPVTGKKPPVIGIVTRFVAHKGVDLIRYVFEDIVRLGFKFAILGSGEKIYEDFFKEMAWRYPQQVSLNCGFIPELAMKIYSGADLFLMPSQSEPCGLAQMISCRYGTPPIVRETGGLKDTITDCGTPDGNGFTFKTYNAHDMLASCDRAIGYYYSKHWNSLVKKVMEIDFSWNTSAKLYTGLYTELCP
jgi:starch synthase